MFSGIFRTQPGRMMAEVLQAVGRTVAVRTAWLTCPHTRSSRGFSVNYGNGEIATYTRCCYTHALFHKRQNIVFNSLFFIVSTDAYASLFLAPVNLLTADITNCQHHIEDLFYCASNPLKASFLWHNLLTESLNLFLTQQIWFWKHLTAAHRWWRCSWKYPSRQFLHDISCVLPEIMWCWQRKDGPRVAWSCLTSPQCKTLRLSDPAWQKKAQWECVPYSLHNR